MNIEKLKRRISRALKEAVRASQFIFELDVLLCFEKRTVKLMFLFIPWCFYFKNINV